MWASTLRIIEVWEHLRSAEEGKHSYGGDVAEIYYYLLMPHMPAHPKCAEWESHKEDYVRIEQDFQSLFHHYERSRTQTRGKNGKTGEPRPPIREVTLMMQGNGPDPDEWLTVDDYFAKYAGTNIHRYHVKVVVNECPDYDYDNEEVLAAN